MGEMSAADTRLLQLFDHPTGLAFAIAVALAVGALHALAPGHGKTIAAAYLLGARSRARDAVKLGVIVAGMHTASVVALALGWLALSQVTTTGVEVATAWMQVAAAVVVLGVGAVLVRRRFARPPGHDHDHEHHHPHGHAHVPEPGVEPWSRRGLTALGASGGLLPSPSAFLVLISGLVTGRTVTALVLVLAFAVGLAGTLAVIGVVTVRGRDAMLRRFDGGGLVAVQAVLPRVAAVAVVGLGATYLVLALRTVAGA